MSVMFEVLYKSPPDVQREAAISEHVGHFGGRLTYREEPEALAGEPVCLTYEFDGFQKAQEAASRLRSQGEHVEGPMDYGEPSGQIVTQFKYNVVFITKGISVAPEEGDIEVARDDRSEFVAYLTKNADKLASYADTSVAIGTLLLGGVVGRQSSDDFSERLECARKEISEQRQKKVGGNSFLVIETKGKVNSFTPTNQVETPDLIVCFNGADKSPIRQQFESAITAVVNALTSTVESLVTIEQVSNAVIFFTEQGKPVYSYSIAGSAADLYVSRRIKADRIKIVRERYQAFVRDASLERVQRLLRLSLETRGDGLRSFLSAWAAIEILMGKLFKIYEERFFVEIANEKHPNARKGFIDSIRRVMTDKYRLIDKFSLVASRLSPETADKDLKLFSDLKKQRDELSHGELVDEGSLPAESVRLLALRFLTLYVTSAVSEPRA